MIERQLLKKNKIELGVRDFIKQNLRSALVSDVMMQKTPLGEKIVVYCAKPGLIVGRKGTNIRQITTDLKERFKLENPQLEISEVKDKYLNAKIVASMLSGLLEQYGSMRFKGIAHKMIRSVMDSGAMGVEIRLSGKLPSARAKVWRFYEGYLKKSGDVAVSQVEFARDFVNLKMGTIGIVVRIMRGDVRLPDKIVFLVDNDEIQDGVEKSKNNDNNDKLDVVKEADASEKSEEIAVKTSDALESA